MTHPQEVSGLTNYDITNYDMQVQCDCFYNLTSYFHKLILIMLKKTHQINTKKKSECNKTKIPLVSVFRGEQR